MKKSKKTKQSYDINKEESDKKPDDELMDGNSLQIDYEYCFETTDSNAQDDFEVYLGPYSCAASENFISTYQKNFLVVGVLLSVVAGAMFTETIILCIFLIGSALHVFLTITKHLIFISHKVGKIANCLRDHYIKRGADIPKTETVKSSELPMYSILLPVFMEESPVIQQLFEAISNIDYPKERLQVLLILETIDSTTKNHIQNIDTSLNYEMVLVPDFKPRTKAKACNYALKFVRGDYVVIFDADDIPDKDQLHVALEKFNDSNDLSLACLQAKLNYYNADENLLTRLFSLEYSILFERILPVLSQKNYPLPLGGTSNHFKTEVLKKLRGWDIYNLAEDAEIGMRLSANGYKTQVINSYTAEECPVTILAWIKQRSRWFKGFIQTYLLYMQDNYNLSDKIGFKKSLISLHFMVGLSTISLIMTTIMLISGIFLKITHTSIKHQDFITDIFLASGILWITTTTIQTIKMLRSSIFLKNISWIKKSVCIIVFPMYFTLHIAAALHSIFDLIRRPFYWSRTKHGITKKILNKISSSADIDTKKY
jgi:cellulose synthase/poly-beta-1,6-N-acetylglucosamine synthase-like glycosyltransferase